MNLQEKNYNLFDLIKIPVQVTPLFSLIVILNKIIVAFIPSMTVLVTADFINTAMEIFSGKTPHVDIYIPLFLFMALIAYGYVNGVLMSVVTMKLNMKLNQVFRLAMVGKRGKLTYKHIENNKTWDIINRTCEDPTGKVVAGFS